jgi:hypothetical protein
MRTPALRRHKASAQGVVTFNGRDFYLSPRPDKLRPPPPSVRQSYDRLIAEWLAGGRQLPRDRGDSLTVAEVIARFWSHLDEHYRRPDGTPTSEVNEFKLALRPLNWLYGDLPAAEFSPLKLEAVRSLMVDGYRHAKYGPQETLARGVVNQRVGRIVRLFKWATNKELVVAGIHQGLNSVPGLEPPSDLLQPAPTSRDPLGLYRRKEEFASIASPDFGHEIIAWSADW